MELLFNIAVTVDPSAIEGVPATVVRDEIASNLESVDYVQSVAVAPAGPVEQTTRVGAPIRLPRQGNVEATLFPRIGPNGTSYAASIQRRVMDGDQPRYTDRFEVSDMPDVMKQAAAIEQRVRDLGKGRGRG